VLDALCLKYMWIFDKVVTLDGCEIYTLCFRWSWETSDESKYHNMIITSPAM
jgi:hypothetical protein